MGIKNIELNTDSELFVTCKSPWRAPITLAANQFKDLNYSENNKPNYSQNLCSLFHEIVIHILHLNDLKG